MKVYFRVVTTIGAGRVSHHCEHRHPTHRSAQRCIDRLKKRIRNMPSEIKKRVERVEER